MAKKNKIVCENKVYYDNLNNYRYIVTTYKNGYQVIDVIGPYRGCFLKIGTLKGFNLNIVL